MTWVEWAMGLGPVSFGGAVFACAFFRGARAKHRCTGYVRASRQPCSPPPWCERDATVRAGDQWWCWECWKRVSR